MSDDLTDNERGVLQILFEQREGKSPSANDMAITLKIDVDDVLGAIEGLRERGLISGPPSLLQRCAELLREMDKDFGPTATHYAEAIIMIASFLSKADERFLAKRLGYDSEFVALVGGRLRAAKIWDGDSLADDARIRWGQDGTSFGLDLLIASGDLKRAGGPDDNPQFMMTESGKIGAVAFIKRMNEDKT